jgi:hypothetical protein
VIDYALMNKEGRRLKSALTRARNSGDALKVFDACDDAVKTWERVGAWPDNWSLWQRTMDDAAWKSAKIHAPFDIGIFRASPEAVAALREQFAKRIEEEASYA